MAILSPINSSVHPVSSISLPSRPNPNSLKIETQITKLRTWEVSSNNPLSADTIQMGLTKLAELFNGIQELIHSPLTQQAIHHDQHSSEVEEALEGSVGLLDVCSTVRDLFLTMKEHVQELQSALRRRGARDSSIESNAHSYITFRKKTKKEITKSIKTLRRMESNVNGSFPLRAEADNHSSYVIEVVRQARAAAISIFRSLVLFLSMPEMKTNTSGWSFLSKVIRSGLLTSDKGQKIFNEVGNVDIALCSIQVQIRRKDAKFDVQEVQKKLETLDLCINGFDAKLDCIFRCLIQNRLSLLNLFTS